MSWLFDSWAEWAGRAGWAGWVKTAGNRKGGRAVPALPAHPGYPAPDIGQLRVDQVHQVVIPAAVDPDARVFAALERLNFRRIRTRRRVLLHLGRIGLRNDRHD